MTNVQKTCVKHKCNQLVIRAINLNIYIHISIKKISNVFISDIVSIHTILCAFITDKKTIMAIQGGSSQYVKNKTTYVLCGFFVTLWLLLSMFHTKTIIKSQTSQVHHYSTDKTAQLVGNLFLSNLSKSCFISPLLCIYIFCNQY